VDSHGESKWIDTEKFYPDGVVVAMAVFCSAKAQYTFFFFMTQIHEFSCIVRMGPTSCMSNSKYRRKRND
jgi:hypothetical protein